MSRENAIQPLLRMKEYALQVREPVLRGSIRAIGSGNQAASVLL
jgi:hypothetical protein